MWDDFSLIGFKGSPTDPAFSLIHHICGSVHTPRHQNHILVKVDLPPVDPEAVVLQLNVDKTSAGIIRAHNSPPSLLRLKKFLYLLYLLAQGSVWPLCWAGVITMGFLNSFD